MEEEVFNGNEIASIVSEAQGINDYNSIRFWVDGKEVLASNLKMVVYNDPDQS